MENVTEQEAWENLANAVVLQAVKDYRRALQIKDEEGSFKSIRRIRECERFFRSGYFDLLTGIDGERLIHDLRREAE